MDDKEVKAMLDAMNEDKQGGKKKFWSLDSKFEGTKTIRILPPLTKKGETRFYFPHKVHWIERVPYEALDQTVVVDGKTLHEAERDPVQDYVKKLYNASERGSDEWKLASEINARPRYISRIIVRNPEDPTTEVQPVFYEYGPTIYNMLFHIMTETDFGIIVDPKNGRDFNLTKTGVGRQSKYETSTPSANTSPIFTDKDMLLKMFTSAMEMDYSSLISFSSAAAKEEALNSYLGITKKTSVTVPDNAVTNTPAMEIPVVTQDFEDDTDDDIDSILDEFTK